MCIRILKPLKTEKEEEILKDNYRKDGEFTAPHPNHEKTMTSLFPACQKLEGGDYPYSVMRECSNSEMNSFNHVSPHTNTIILLRPQKLERKKRK